MTFLHNFITNFIITQYQRPRTGARLTVTKCVIMQLRITFRARCQKLSNLGRSNFVYTMTLEYPS